MSEKNKPPIVSAAYDEGYEAFQRDMSQMIVTTESLNAAFRRLPLHDFKEFHKGYHESQIDGAIDVWRDTLRTLAKADCNMMLRTMRAIFGIVNMFDDDGEEFQHDNES